MLVSITGVAQEFFVTGTEIPVPRLSLPITSNLYKYRRGAVNSLSARVRQLPGLASNPPRTFSPSYSNTRPRRTRGTGHLFQDLREMCSRTAWEKSHHKVIPLMRGAVWILIPLLLLAQK
jgi:hypothetical protein